MVQIWLYETERTAFKIKIKLEAQTKKSKENKSQNHRTAQILRSTDQDLIADLIYYVLEQRWQMSLFQSGQSTELLITPRAFKEEKPGQF